MFDIGLAMENLCLAAPSLGLGTVIIGRFDAKKVEALIGVPENISVVAIIPLGYPQREVSAPKRREVADFVHFETYRKAHDTHCIRLLEQVNLSRQNLRNVEGLSLIREKEEGTPFPLPPFYLYFDVPQGTVNMP